MGKHGARSKKMHILPIMALSVGFLGGLFGIGGGMLLSPLILQIGLEPEVSFSSFFNFRFAIAQNRTIKPKLYSYTVLLYCQPTVSTSVSSSMSAIQYLLLGMKQAYGALIYSAVCFVGSLVGLIIVQRAITKYGRASIVVFSVGIVFALSTILITGYGALDIWKDFTTGQSLGFKKPC